MELVSLRVGSNPAIAVRQCGEGELLIFLHGIGGSSASWLRQLPVFGAGFRAVALDFRGYGDSDDYEGPASFAAFSGDVARVLDHYGVAKAHICGLSLGARIAQRFYRLYPDRVASLVLADARPDGVDTRTQEERDAFFNLRARPLLEGKKPEEAGPAVTQSLLGPNPSAELLEELRQSASKRRTESYLKTVRANLDDYYKGEPIPIQAPTLILVGEHDRLNPPSVARGLAQEIAGAEVVIIPDAGHLSNMEQPELFNEAVSSFLSRIKEADR